MKRATPNQGKLLPFVEGEPNFYEIDEHFPLAPAQGRVQCPSLMNGCAGDGAPQRPSIDYPSSSFYPGINRTTPPFYGYQGDMFAPMTGSYQPFLPQHPMQLGREADVPRYCHSLTEGPSHGNQSHLAEHELRMVSDLTKGGEFPAEDESWMSDR